MQDSSFLAAALEGLELRRQQIEEQIRNVRAMMGQGSPAVAAAAAPRAAATAGAPKTGKKRTLSPAARKRIAAAQKKRWAEFRKAKGGEASE